MTRGTVKDPKLPRRTAYLRWFVLETLLPLRSNARGSGARLSAGSLLDLYRGAPREFADVSARELGQAARHFALEAVGERCLYWVNADGDLDAAFGVSRGRRDAAERLAVAYGIRLAAEERAELPWSDFEEPEPEEGESEPVGPRKLKLDYDSLLKRLLEAQERAIERRDRILDLERDLVTARVERGDAQSRAAYAEAVALRLMTETRRTTVSFDPVAYLDYAGRLQVDRDAFRGEVAVSLPRDVAKSFGLLDEWNEGRKR